MVEKTIFSAKITAFLSFVIGTMILLLYILTYNTTNFMLFGLFYVILAFLINSLFVLVLFVLAAKPRKNQKDIWRTIGIMLLNIPVVILYIYVVIELNP